MRKSFKLTILAFAVAATLAIVPAASATTFDILVGSTVVGTATLTSGAGTCGTFTTDSSDVCLQVTMTGGNELRVGGDVIGLAGSATEIDFDSSGLLGIVTHPCNANLRAPSPATTVCITAGSGADVSSLTLVLDGSISGIVGFHVIGPACGPATDDGFPTCFSTVGPVPTIPEPGTLSLLGTGLIGLAGVFRRRFLK